MSDSVPSPSSTCSGEDLKAEPMMDSSIHTEVETRSSLNECKDLEGRETGYVISGEQNMQISVKEEEEDWEELNVKIENDDGVEDEEGFWKEEKNEMDEMEGITTDLKFVKDEVKIECGEQEGDEPSMFFTSGVLEQPGVPIYRLEIANNSVAVQSLPSAMSCEGSQGVRSPWNQHELSPLVSDGFLERESQVMTLDRWTDAQSEVSLNQLPSSSENGMNTEASITVITSRKENTGSKADDGMNMRGLDDNSNLNPDYVPENEALGDCVEASEGDIEDSDSKNEPVKKGKKRDRKPSEWIRNKRKHLRAQGKAYINAAGNPVSPKTLVPLKDHVCRLKCCDKVSESQRKDIFQKFWAIGDFEQQNSFLCSVIKTTKTGQHRDRKDPNASRRTYSHTYHLITPSGVVTVCKAFFLATFVVSNGRLNRILRKQLTVGGDVPDRRGKHSHHRTLDKARLEEIKAHISSFPSFESDFTTSHQQSRRYLSPDLTVAKMYELYCEKCKEQEKEPLKEWVYRRIFVTDFNLSFHSPRKDMQKE
ncbi:hypothetical protein GJAV_G00224050 [Gymnothorax javanicus]|nr:hypothetical protein GJAV_G00224050 [Gymnothorax javanicus]